MKLKPFQLQDYARFAMVNGGILAHEQGLGKTFAAFTWGFLKAGFRKVPNPKGAGSHRVLPNEPVLIVAPGGLHTQFINTGRDDFKTPVVPLDSQDTFLRLSKLDPATGRRVLPPAFYIVSYTQLGLNGVAGIPDPAKIHPEEMLAWLGYTREDVANAFNGGGLASDSKGYYKLLGVPRCATKQEITRAYRVLTKKYHPDVSSEPDAEEMTKALNAAHDVLSDTAKRRAYDAKHQPRNPTHATKRTCSAGTTGSKSGVIGVQRHAAFEELTRDEQLEFIQEFCIAKHNEYSKNVGVWNTDVEEDQGKPSTPDHGGPASRWRIKCVFSPTLADLCSETFAAVAVDEAVRMKGGEDTCIGQGVMQLTPRFRAVLTGTPIKNRIPDIFALLWWSCGGDLEGNPRFPYGLKEKDTLAETFCVTERNLSAMDRAQKNGMQRHVAGRFIKRTPQVCNVHLFWKLAARSIIRRRKADIGEQIVEKRRQVLRIPMGTRQAAEYRECLAWNPRDVNGLPATGAKLQALRMVAASCVNSGGLTPKAALNLSMIETVLRRGEQVILFSPFHEPLDAMSMRLKDAGVPHYVCDGRVSDKARSRMAEDFKRGLKPVILASIGTMSEGYSFPHCNNTAQHSYDWALDKGLQAEDRAHRLNSVRALNAYRLICDGTIDRQMECQMNEKADAAEMILDGHLLGENPAEVNMADLLEIAAREFNPESKTVDEAALEAHWLTIAKPSLAEAARNWKFTVPTQAQSQPEAAKALPLPALPSLPAPPTAPTLPVLPALPTLPASADVRTTSMPSLPAVVPPLPATARLGGWRAHWAEKAKSRSSTSPLDQGNVLSFHLSSNRQ